MAEWPAERAKYSAWWSGASGSLAKRDGADQMRKTFGALKRGRERLAEYAVMVMDDSQERTWRAGYDLFRQLAGQSFGLESGNVHVDERRRITSKAQQWLSAYGVGGR